MKNLNDSLKETLKDIRKGCKKYGIHNTTDTDNFLREVDRKIWINPKEEEHQLVEKFVSGFVESVLYLIKQEHNLDLKLIKSGSYYVNHRVGRPYEFDYLLEIPVGKFYLITNKHVYNNYMKAHICVNPELEEWCEADRDSDGDVYESQGVRDCIFHYLKTYVSQVEANYSGLDVEIVDPPSYAPALAVKMFYNKIGISLDLVPCIKYPLAAIQAIPDINKSVVDFVYKMIQSQNVEDTCTQNKCSSDADTGKVNLGHIRENTDIIEPDSSEGKQDAGNLHNVEHKLKTGTDAEDLDKAIDAEDSTDELSSNKSYDWFFDWFQIPGHTMDGLGCADVEYICNNQSEKNKDLTYSCVTDKYAKVLHFFVDHMYLVITSKDRGMEMDGSQCRISTSVIENSIMLNLENELVQALRLAKYFLQTFNIPIFFHEIEERWIERDGFSSILPSRWVTVIFYLITFSCEVFTSDFNLTERVCLLLQCLVFGKYHGVKRMTIRGLFDYKFKYQEVIDTDSYVNNPMNPYDFDPTKSIMALVFREKNLDTIHEFALFCMKTKDMHPLHLLSIPNVCKCELCFKKMNGTKVTKNIFHEFPYSSLNEDEYVDQYPKILCYMHEYIVHQRILCYHRLF